MTDLIRGIWPRSHGQALLVILSIPLLLFTHTGFHMAFGGWTPQPPTSHGGVVRVSDTALLTEGDIGDGHVVTAGLGIKTSDESSFVIRSYEAQSGSLISEDEFELSVDEDTANVVEKGEGRIYAVGSGVNDQGRLSLLIRAYDAQTGNLLWEDDLNPSREQILKATFLRAALKNTILEGEDRMAAQPGSQSSYLVQAVDAKTGHLLWKDEFLTDNTGPSHDNPPEQEERDQGENLEKTFSIHIRTYDRHTGSMLWYDELSSAHENKTGLGDESGIEHPHPKKEEAAVSPRCQVRLDSNHGQRFADRS